jgi:hypothetical protein
VEKPQAPTRRLKGRVSQSDVPRHSIVEARRVAQVIEDHYGGTSASPLDVATSLDSTPSSSWFRTVTGAAVAYGLTDGAYNSAEIKLTPLGRRLVAPTAEGDDGAALVEAIQRPRVMREFLTKYDRKKLPPEAIAQNVLAAMGVDKDATGRTLKVILDSALSAQVLRNLKGDNWVDLRLSPQNQSHNEVDEGEEDDVIDASDSPELSPSGGPTANDPTTVDSPAPMKVFVAHGRTKKPLDQLKQVLNEWQVPFLVAVDEPNAGRPISEKVAELMKACTAGIFIFTADDEFQDASGGSVFRPSQNVIYELGAASLLYGRKIVVFKEKGVTFPSDFNDLGWIEFERDALDAKAVDLLRELIALKAIRLVSTAG